MEPQSSNSEAMKEDDPQKNGLEDSKQSEEEQNESIFYYTLGSSSAERLSRNPYASSSSQSQSEDESSPKRKPSKSRSRSRSRSRSHSPKREVRRHYHESEGYDRKDSSRRHHNTQDSWKPKIIKPGLNGPLLSYKHFMELQRDPIEPEEAEKYYNEYKNSRNAAGSTSFF